MYFDQLSEYEYNLWNTYEDCYLKAIEILEQYGFEGKMYLAALLNDKVKFKELYKQEQEDAYLALHDEK